MIGVLLFILSFILVVLLTPIGFIFTTIKTIILLDFRFIKTYYMNLAISLDQFGNVACGELLNTILITDIKHLFGNPDETISSVLGKNKLNNSLTKLGTLLDNFLNKLDDNHSIKSIEK